ncbi:uncharacterized protein [Palaemon carinicauda]|uniref:uncharacterized protein n=1 Tax=Palaemon carinicauda TaxID=392227 RepID=UPI0035B5ECCF
MSQEQPPLPFGPLTYDELTKAKTKLFQCVQREAYPQDILALTQGKQLKKGSPLNKLDPFLDNEGLFIIKGRLEYSDLCYESKHPIILPPSNTVKALVRFQHVLLKHAGVSTLMSTLRNSYSIVRLRRLAKAVCRECVSCRKQDSKACRQPVAPLPELRVKSAPPFTVTGLDYAGPLFCADMPLKKLYILLFTCTVQHYGPVAPQWKFIVARAPWWGSWWEGLIRPVKSALKKTLGTKCLSRRELETTLHEVEACIISRPLTFVGKEPDISNPLTPSHFLLGRTAGFQPDNVDEHFSCVTSRDLCMRESARQRQLEKFWEKWSSEYIRNLPCNIKGFVSKCNLKKGSMVLVSEDNVPRLSWPLGVIVKVYPGKDSFIRSVDVETSKGVINRPVQKLHDLEISSASDLVSDYNVPSSDTHENSLSGPVSVNSCEDVDKGEFSTAQPVVERTLSYTRKGRAVRAPEKLNL